MPRYYPYNTNDEYLQCNLHKHRYVEALKKYQFGKLLPIIVGKEIPCRNFINLKIMPMAKLGNGGRCTVWMLYDKRSENERLFKSTPCIALKCYDSAHTSLDDAKEEVKLVQQLSKITKVVGCTNLQHLITVDSKKTDGESHILSLMPMSNVTVKGYLGIRGPQSLKINDRIKIALRIVQRMIELHKHDEYLPDWSLDNLVLQNKKNISEQDVKSLLDGYASRSASVTSCKVKIETHTFRKNRVIYESPELPAFIPKKLYLPIEKNNLIKLVDPRLEVRIIDLDKKTNARLIYAYPPASKSGNYCTKEANLWTLASLLYELITGAKPLFSSENGGVAQEFYDWPTEQKREWLLERFTPKIIGISAMKEIGDNGKARFTELLVGIYAGLNNESTRIYADLEDISQIYKVIEPASRSTSACRDAKVSKLDSIHASSIQHPPNTERDSSQRRKSRRDSVVSTLERTKRASSSSSSTRSSQKLPEPRERNTKYGSHGSNRSANEKDQKRIHSQHSDSGTSTPPQPRHTSSRNPGLLRLVERKLTQPSGHRTQII